MDRVARNHDVSRQTANHNIIALLDHAILLLPRYLKFFRHIYGGTTVVEREELAARMGGQLFFSESRCILLPIPASNLQVTSCCASERLKHIGIFRKKQEARDFFT